MNRYLIVPALLVAIAGPLEAQRPPTPEPVRATRSLAVGNLVRFGATTSATTGILYQVSFRRSTIERMPAGNVVERFPRYYAHLLGTAGVAWRGDALRPATFGQIGVARRNDHALITLTALAGQWAYRPHAYGPVARIEIKDNVGVQAGWLFIDDGGSGLFLSLDYMRDILADLGLR